MKKYLARDKTTGLFLKRGNPKPWYIAVDKINDSNLWNKPAHIKSSIAQKNGQHKRIVRRTAIDFNNLEIIELDISEILMDRIQKRAQP